MSTMYRIGVLALAIGLLFFIIISTHLPYGSIMPTEHIRLLLFKNDNFVSSDPIPVPKDGIQNEVTVAPVAGVNKDGDNYTCPELPRTTYELQAQRDDLHGWKPVIEEEMFVFSAYVDPNSRAALTVHVVGLAKRSCLDKEGYRNVTCQLWVERTTRGDAATHMLIKITPAIAYKVGADKPSVAFRIRCEFDQEIPQANGQYMISLVDGAPCSKPLNRFRVDNTLNHSRSDMDTFRVCIGSPVRYNYSNYQRFVEFMEMNAILGVQGTTLYHLDSSPVMKPFFEYYTARKMLTLVTWIPPQTLESIQHEGQPALNQDCVLRHMWKTKYVAIFDIDESIIPRGARTYTWSDMLKSTNCEGRSLIQARNVFFRTDYPDDESFTGDRRVALRYKLSGLLKTWRTELFMERERAKTILRPENIELGHTHHSKIRAELNETKCIMNTSQGALHHYRDNTESLVKEEYFNHVVEDRTCHKYASDIIKRVKRVYSDVNIDDHVRAVPIFEADIK